MKFTSSKLRHAGLRGERGDTRQTTKPLTVFSKVSTPERVFRILILECMCAVVAS